MTKEEHKELLETIKIGNATLSRMEDHIARMAALKDEMQTIITLLQEADKLPTGTTAPPKPAESGQTVLENEWELNKQPKDLSKEPYDIIRVRAEQAFKNEDMDILFQKIMKYKASTGKFGMGVNMDGIDYFMWASLYKGFKQIFRRKQT